MSSENVARLIEKQKATSLQRFWKKEKTVNSVPQEKKIFENCFSESKRSDDRFPENFCSQDIRDINVEKPEQIWNPSKRKEKGKTESKKKTFDNTEHWNNSEYPSEESNGFDEEYTKKLTIRKPEFASEVRNNRELSEYNEKPEAQQICKGEEGIKDEDNSLVSNSISSELDPIHAKPQNGEYKREDEQTMNKETESMALSDNKELFEIDETDYYDSEDEFWSTHPSGESFLDYPDDYLTLPVQDSQKGRFSKGLEQLTNLPVFRRSIHKFAIDNNFEVYDVKSDGNCMFCALADQLLINGFPGHTEISLRTDAINYLRSHSLEEDGANVSSFLSEESWEDYLDRMERSGEWGDHIILQALVDIFCLEVIVFNVFQEDIRRTEVIAESNERFSNRLTIYLGHLGEFHYMSLRPKNWLQYWPYKALLGRLLVCSSNKTLEDRENILRNTISSMHSSTYIPKSELDKTAGFVLHFIKRSCATHRDIVDNQLPKAELFHSYSGQDLQLEDTEDSLQCLIEDPLLTDPISGVPLPHLTIILKHLMPSKLIKKPSPKPSSLETPFHLLGFEDGSEQITLSDISSSKKMEDFYNKQTVKMNVAFLMHDLRVTKKDFLKDDTFMSYLYFEDSDTRPGYCRLKFPDGQVPKSDQNTLRTESGLFLRAYNVPVDMKELSKILYNEITYIGIRCGFPFVGLDWFTRRRHFDFPSKTLLLKIYAMCCTLIPKAHHQSDNPSIEWEVDFSLIDSLIMDSLTNPQLYGFAVIKVLLENMTFHHNKRLKAKHLKAVFFKACEEMPTSLWESNLSGCFLLVLSKLLICLKSGFLPHYFIPEKNLLDDFSANDINTLCVYVESIRVFPVQVTQFIVEKHGFAYGPNLVRSVLKDTQHFAKTREIDPVVSIWIPLTYRTARFLSRFGYYKTTCEVLESIHKLTTVSSGNRAQESFFDFFNGALQLMKQRSSRVILAKLYDEKFGTKMVNLYLHDSDQSLGKILSWNVSFKINWLEIPCNISGDLISIAEFLYKHSLREREKRNVILSVEFIETAIKCIERAVKEDSLGVEDIDDKELKHDILSQKRELKAKLKKYYIQVYYLSTLNLKRSPIEGHMPDIENLCKEFPEMSSWVSFMFKFLGNNEKSRWYAEKSHLV